MQGLLSKLYMKAKSWNIPQFDTYGPVFYLPLWRQNMIARGGYIQNGTGTMSGTSPFILLVAANTITVTQAGNFTVKIPYGGTVASVTATITGSPVTVSAGVATTIIAEGTGNFTVTPSNIIRSLDKIGYTSTVAGATWRIQGRSFNEYEDNIDVAIPPALSGLTEFTFCSWYKCNAFSGILNFIFTIGGYKEAVYGSDSIIQGSVYYSITNAVSVTTTVPTFGKLVFFTMTYSESGDRKVHIYFDSIEASYSSQIPSVGTVMGGETYLKLGGDSIFGLNGMIGEACLYNRALSAGEIQRNYEVTKWRYRS